MTFKLPPDTVKAWLNQKDTKLFDPGDMGRPMKEWVGLTPTSGLDWSAVATEALAFVRK